jgi:hypothetical protein
MLRREANRPPILVILSAVMTLNSALNLRAKRYLPQIPEFKGYKLISADI